MRIVKKIVLGLIILIAVFMGIGLLLPSGYKVERSTVIHAPAEVVFDQVNDLKKNEAWSPWKDPTMRITYGPVTVGMGASSSWTSKDMGSGTQTIEESVPHSSIRTHLDFGDMGQAKAYWSFVPEGEGVKATQSMSGDQGMNPVKRWLGIMMDNMIGPYFEKGLASLKQTSEARAAELAARPSTEASAPVNSALALPADSTSAAAGISAGTAGAAASGAEAGVSTKAK